MTVKRFLYSAVQVFLPLVISYGRNVQFVDRKLTSESFIRMAKLLE